MKNPQKIDDKLKPLMPSMRTKKRFLRISIESSHQFTFKEISEELTEELLLLLGAIDLGKSGFWILREFFEYNNQEFICKVTLNYCEKIIGAINIVSKIGNYDVAFRVEKVSGTLKGVKKS